MIFRFPLAFFAATDLQRHTIARFVLYFLASTSLLAAAPNKPLQFIRVSPDGHHFTFAKSTNEFRVWGFNYDHDSGGRLLEEYWDKEWKTVTEDFAEMKSLGANTARIHLQVASFMKSEREANRAS